MRSLPRLACLLAGLAACAVAAAQPATPVAPLPRLKRVGDAEVARLIARVGSPSYPEREAATEELMRRPEAQAAVEKALAAASSPEVTRRLSAVAATLKREWARRRLAKLPEYVKYRQFDRLVETMVLCREHLTDEHDRQIEAFLKGVYDDATGRKPHRFTSGENWPGLCTFAWKKLFDLPDGSQRGLGVVGRSVTEPLGRSAVCASERIGPPPPADGGLAVVNRSALLCNGDVELWIAEGCFVVATGTVQIHSVIGGSVVVGFGDIVTASCDYSVVVSRKSFDRLRTDRDSLIRSEDTEFFRGWQLFSRADTGADLRSAFGVVWIAAVESGSPFEAAGARPGDLLVRVDGTAVGSVADAQRLLCRASVGHGHAELLLLREGQSIRTMTKLQDWE